MTPTLTPELLADLRNKAGAATPGQWHTHGKECGAPEVVESPSGPVACTDLSNDRLSREQEQADAAHIAAANPAVVLALLDRIEALERDAEPPCGCGRPAEVRGDPECSGCGKDCYFCECDPLPK